MSWSTVTVTPPIASTRSLKPHEVDLHVVVHADPGHLLHRLDHTGRTDLRVDGVEHHPLRRRDLGAVLLGAGGPGHEGVARDAHGDGLLAALRYVHHQCRVRAGSGDLPGLQGGVVPGARVRAQDQYVPAGGGQLLGAVVADRLVDVDALDVPVEVAVQPVADPAPDQDEQDQAQRDPTPDTASARPSLPSAGRRTPGPAASRLRRGMRHGPLSSLSCTGSWVRASSRARVGVRPGPAAAVLVEVPPNYRPNVGRLRAAAPDLSADACHANGCTEMLWFPP